MEGARYARGKQWHVHVRKPDGCFAIIHENSLFAVWRCLQAGDVELRDVRTWLACHELRERRCDLGDGRRASYTIREIHQLVGGAGAKHIRRSLSRLEACDLLRFHDRSLDLVPACIACDKGRLIPVPRRLVRHLAKARGRAYIATVLGHLVRCLYLYGDTCRSGGWCKASWVAQNFGVAIRAVKDARKTLTALGILHVLEADQKRLNRLGCPVVVGMNWGSESAPPRGDSETESAPPYRHKNLSTRRVDHQNPDRASDSAGAYAQLNQPELANVTEADLDDPWRLAALFKQARHRRWVSRCEADILAVFAAAAHATRVGTTNRPGLFRWLVANRRWENLSNRDEDRARTMLNRLRECRSSPSVGELNPRNEVRCVAS